MEFYQISCGANGRYELIEEDGSRDSASLSNAQLGRLADRLSALYWAQEDLPLRIRIYLTAYYSQGQTEYISVKSTPSLLLSETRLHALYDETVSLDGFALTFLEGEEENRVWIGEDGAVENRGESTDKVRDLLEIMIESLNEPAAVRYCLASSNCPSPWLEKLSALGQQLESGAFGTLLDLNQEMISWCEVRHGETWETIPFQALDAQPAPEAFRLPLLAKGAHYELLLEDDQLTLAQYSYTWEKAQLPKALWDQLLSLLQGEGTR